MTSVQSIFHYAKGIEVLIQSYFLADSRLRINEIVEVIQPTA